MSEPVDTYIRALRSADGENAYHRLIEIGPAVLPALAAALRTEADSHVRAVLVRIAGQVRSSSAVDLLAEALAQDDDVVWKEALDGLVATGGPVVRTVVDRARVSATAPKSQWLDEAIEQLTVRRD
jgi:alpha-beta hydrolase superfamily lysophospholipase